MSEKIRVLKVEPHKHPEEAFIENSLEGMQEAVGGLIEFVYLEDGASVLCNEEGKLIGLEGNRSLGEDILVGTFYVVGDNDEGETVSLSDSLFTKYKNFFEEPESFTKEQIENSITFRIFPL